MPIILDLLKGYWKIIVAVIAVASFTFYVHHNGYVEGKAEVQKNWDAARANLAVAAANAAAVNETKTNDSEKETQDENSQLKVDIATIQDFYAKHFNHSPSIVLSTSGKRTAIGSAMPSVPDSTKQPDNSTANSVSHTEEEYNKLEADCAVTTEMLLNAAEWGKTQTEIFNKEQ